MSTYAWISGTLNYKTKKKYDAAKKVLEDGGWVKDKKWFNEANDEAGDFGNELPKLIITIPEDYYRNLVHKLKELEKLADSGFTIFASTDGMFSGGVWEDGEYTKYDLGKWAKNNSSHSKPTLKDCDGNEDRLLQKIADWQEAVIHEFFDEHG